MWIFSTLRGGVNPKSGFSEGGVLGPISTLSKIFFIFFKNFVLFHPVLEKIFFWGGWEKFGLDFALFLVPIPPSKVGIPLTRLQNFKFLWVGRSFSGENRRNFSRAPCPDPPT